MDGSDLGEFHIKDGDLKLYAKLVKVNKYQWLGFSNSIPMDDSRKLPKIQVQVAPMNILKTTEKKRSFCSLFSKIS